ncbi:MAG: ketopantoate reductase family protein [Lachnospirales bacterium]
MKLLIYGAGVIGSHYAARLTETGFDVSILARGKRLAELYLNGFRYKKGEIVLSSDVTVIETLNRDDYYDYIFLTVREEQLYEALQELHDNVSPTIVTMVNTIELYENLELLCGKGKLLPAFPGAGGGFSDGVLDAEFTPAFIQPTTFGEIDGVYSQRSKILKGIFKKANISCQIVGNMHMWQVCHLAMVVPLADAYYNTLNPKNVGNDKAVVRVVAQELRENFRDLHKNNKQITPFKLNIFRLCPNRLLALLLAFVYRSNFADKFMYRHSINAKSEMQRLHKQLYVYMETE